jgi:hypothetical protein
MALITDPDNLLDGGPNAGTDDSNQNIYINTALRTIKIRNNAAAPSGPELSNDGVTLQALYSFLKEEWKNDPKSKDLINYPFPLVAITPEQFEFRFGWTPADDSSRSLIRTGGWREVDLDGATVNREYIGTISLGNIQGSPREENASVNQHKVYYAFFDSASGVSTAGPFNYDYSGEVNQAVQTLDSTSFDRRGDILRLFIRSKPYEAPQSNTAWTFDQTDTTDIGLAAGTTLPFNTQRFPLAEGEDLNIKQVIAGIESNLTDATIEAAQASGQKYASDPGTGAGYSVDYLSAAETSDTFGYSEDLLAEAEPFSVKIAANSLRNKEVYALTQYKLRQDSDIAKGATTKKGKLADELLAFVGPTLTTKQVTNVNRSGIKTGVAITGIAADDINNTQLRDDNNILQSFPFSTAINVTFSQDILDDSANAKAYLFYEYTREYAIGAELDTNIVISGVGTASGDATQDSANFTLGGTPSFTPLLTPAAGPQNVNGLNDAVAADAYFKLAVTTPSASANDGIIWRVTEVYDSSTFAAVTLDDTVSPVNQTITAGSMRTHPINSPGSLMLDSAGATAENNVAQRAETTLAPANLTGGTTFALSYAFDNNSQKDRVKKVGEGNADAVALTVRAIGLESGQWVSQNATVTRQNTNAVTVVSPEERNYSNPA